MVWIRFEYASVNPCVGNLVPSVAMEHGGAFKSSYLLQGKGQFESSSCGTLVGSFQSELL